MKLLHITAAIAALALAAPALAEQPKILEHRITRRARRCRIRAPVPGDPGASGYSPGDQMKDNGPVPGDPGHLVTVPAIKGKTILTRARPPGRRANTTMRKGIESVAPSAFVLFRLPQAKMRQSGEGVLVVLTELSFSQSGKMPLKC